jgi:futalosine hydrolase
MKKLIIAATEQELAMLPEALHCRQKSRLLDFTLYQAAHTASDSPVILCCGAGMANAAAAAALGIERYNPSHIFNVGVCGVYNAGLDAIGTVVTGTRALFADTGIDTGMDFQSMEKIGLPLAQSESGNQVFNSVELNRACGLQCAVFLTVAACSGSPQRAALVSGRFKNEWKDLVCEDMESAAVGLMSWRAGIPCTVVRAISNVCGDRDYANWRMDEAAQAAQEELLACL